jgi:hypothetical protein
MMYIIDLLFVPFLSSTQTAIHNESTTGIFLPSAMCPIVGVGAFLAVKEDDNSFDGGR